VHHLGSTRSSLKADHLLQTPDTFVRSPLPGAEGVEFIIHAAPQLGARFTQMTAEFVAGGSSSKPVESGTSSSRAVMRTCRMALHTRSARRALRA
jgi:(S)-ureidoglycine aminohydrolase